MRANWQTGLGFTAAVETAAINPPRRPSVNRSLRNDRHLQGTNRTRRRGAVSQVHPYDKIGLIHDDGHLLFRRSEPAWNVFEANSTSTWRQIRNLLLAVVPSNAIHCPL